jgi:transposase
MLNESKEVGVVVVVRRCSVGCKKQIVLCLLRGESVDSLSRGLAVPIFRLEEWHDRALAGIDVGLREREGDPVEEQLDDANRRIGELVMEAEILSQGRRGAPPFGRQEVVETSRTTSPGTGKPYGLQRVCRVLDCRLIARRLD